MTNNKIEPIRILYVDDETELLNVGKLFLEKEGTFSVDVLPSVSEALNHLNSDNYDAIISDYEMPGMNGISFLKTLRANGNTTPFIIFTGKGREEVVIEALNCGADFYIQKGGHPKSQFAELSNKVRYAVSRKLTENLLKESEERYRNVVEDQTEFICRFLPDGTHVFVNEAYCRYFGLERNEVIGSKFKPRMPHEDSQKISKLIASLTSNNPHVIIEHRIFMPDGSTRWQRWVDRAIFNLDGSLKEYQSVGRDITELKERELALNENNYQLQTAYEKLASNEEQLRKQIEENKIVTQSLCETEARYHEFFKTARDSVFITSPDGQWIDFNEATVELFGYENREQLSKVSVPSMYANPEERSVFLKRAEIEGYVKEFPLQLKKCDGKIFDTLINIVPLREKSGSIKAFIGSFRDITEQKRMEATLRESEKKYRDIINNMQDVVYRTDLEGKLVMFSPHGVKLAGYNSEEEMIGFDVALDTYQNPEERKRFLVALKEKGFVENFPLVLQARYGRIREVTASSHFYYDDNGNVLGVEGILHDITDLKEKEQELRASEERYRALYNDNPIMLFTLDPEGKVISVNQAGADQLGYTAGELEGQSVLNVFYPKDHRAVTEQLQICLKSPGEGFHWQFRKVRKDGKLIWVEEHARAIISSLGDLSVLVVCQNITDRKQIEDELRQANKKLSLLSSITRHDINNKLTVMKGLLNLMEYEPLDPLLNEYLTKLSTTANRISDMILFTKEYESIGVNAPSWQDLHKLVDTAAKQVSHGRVIVKNSLSSSAEVFADLLIGKVFYNLMDNAMRHGGKITTIRFSIQESGDSHLIICEDDGDGILVEEKEDIFERGFGKNSGLGLTLAREILAITGMTIQETGEPGNGARFEITVPNGKWRFIEDSL